MAGSIYNLTNYYSFLSSPIAKDQMNPVANLVYSSAVSKLYANSIGKNAQSSVSSYLSSLNSNVNKLKIDAKNLSSENSIKSSFNKKAVSSSDNGITGTAANNADKGSYTINVTQLAKAQTNTGIKLDSKADSAFTKGINSFSLKVGNTEKTVTFNVGTDDTNKTSLTSMANAINYTKAGVTASVATDSKTGLSYLNITSDKTGTGSSFTITDKAGNASAVSGANNSTVSAQDAIYSIDGKENTSQTNEAVLDNGKVKIGFTKADGKDINVSVDTDVNSIKDDITKFVNDYNKLISLTHSYSGTFSGASQLEKEFGSALNSKKVSLENAGIHINKDNTLSVDNTKLEKSLKSNTTYVRSIFTGSSGLADKVTSKSNAVIAAPLKYTNLDDMQNNQNSFINYLNSTNKVSPTNPYSGLLVNMLL